MFHVLKDEDTIVAILANVETEQVQDAISKVDKVFRSVVDAVPEEQWEMEMCEKLGIAYTELLMDWRDVLVALLVDGGATEVEYLWHECTPPPEEIREVV